MEVFEEFLHVFFAFTVCVRLVKQRESFYENFSAFTDDLALQLLVEEESFEDSDCGLRVVTVT